MHKIFIAAAIILATVTPIFHPKTIKAQSCDNVKIIFARGSGESLQDVSESAWREELTAKLQKSTLSYEFYELGSRAQAGFKYPAVSVSGSTDGYLTLIGAVVSAGESYNFGASVIDGSNELKTYIDSISKQCPNTKFALGGYSQGAMVISRTLPVLDSESVIYAATFGDPKLYLPEGFGLPSAACLGQQYSSYRVYVPDCQAYMGVLGGYQPYEPDGYSGKLGTWCNQSDIMCSSKWSLSDHTKYVSEGLYQQAAAVITSKLQAAFPEKWQKADLEPSRSTHDLAILIDSTGSMRGMISKYRSEAIRLAEKIWEQGGRVSLYEYRDLDDGFTPNQLCDFSCTREEFVSKLNQIQTDGGGDDAESALSAILTALNTLKWQVGATKSIVLLTDTVYLNPDRDGTTLAEVTQRSLEIDPVNVYTIVPKNLMSDYEELAKMTDGGVFNINNASEATESILDRSDIALENSIYSGLIGDTITFAVKNPESELQYDWDLDGDGYYELIGQSSVEQKFLDAGEYYVKVRATNQNHNISTMSAQVIIYRELPEPAKIVSYVITEVPGGVKVDFNCSTNTSKVLVIVNNAILGYLEVDQSTSFVLTNLSATTELTLIPYDVNQNRGIELNYQITTAVPLTPNSGINLLETGIWAKYYLLC